MPPALGVKVGDPKNRPPADIVDALEEENWVLWLSRLEKLFRRGAVS